MIAARVWYQSSGGNSSKAASGSIGSCTSRFGARELAKRGSPFRIEQTREAIHAPNLHAISLIHLFLMAQLLPSGFTIQSTAVDPNGFIYFGGATLDVGLPTTPGALEPTALSGGAVVMNVDSSGASGNQYRKLGAEKRR